MRLLLSCLLLGLPLLARAQSAPDSTALVAAVITSAPTADTIQPAAGPLAPALPDTLAAVLSAPDTALAALQALPAAEREARGREDARRYYRPSPAVFWGSLGAGLLSPPLLIATASPAALLPLAGAATVGALGPRPKRLQARAPQPTLLRDADYQRGYVHKASNKKVSRALVGWGVGATASMVTIIALLISFLGNGFS